MTRIAIALCMLGTGCLPQTQSFGSGTVGAHPPPLPPGASVPKWDHFCSQVGGTLDEIGRYLDEASENGWELVSWSIAGAGNLACFKRPRIGTPGEAPPASASASSAPAGR